MQALVLVIVGQASKLNHARWAGSVFRPAPDQRPGAIEDCLYCWSAPALRFGRAYTATGALMTDLDELTALEPRPILTRQYPAQPPSRGSMFLALLRTTDHKVTGRMYMVTSFIYFMAAVLLMISGKRLTQHSPARAMSAAGPDCELIRSCWRCCLAEGSTCCARRGRC